MWPTRPLDCPTQGDRGQIPGPGAHFAALARRHAATGVQGAGARVCPGSHASVYRGACRGEHCRQAAALNGRWDVAPPASHSLPGERCEILLDTQDFLDRQDALECPHWCALLAILDNAQELLLAAVVMANGRDGTAHAAPDTLCPVAARTGGREECATGLVCPRHRRWGWGLGRGQRS